MARNGKKMSKLPLTHNLSRLWAQVIIGTLLKKGVRHFYPSPGMRNAPLIAALRHLASSYPDCEIHTGADERAQGLRALGSIRASDRPAVLICTSGSAVAHYFPAVIEAHKTGLPLIVISSDRPYELTQADANQTIEQNKIFGNFAKASLSLEAPNAQLAPAVLQSLISDFCDQAQDQLPGPIHMNAPFREPLASEEDLADWSHPSAKQAYCEQVQATLATPPIQELRPQLTLKESVLLPRVEGPLLIVVGELKGQQERLAVEAFIKEHQDLAMMLDVASGLKYRRSLGQKAIPSMDHPEVYRALQSAPPKTLIHIGGRTTSKHYYRLLNEWQQTSLWLFEERQLLHDPAHRRSLRLKAPLHASLPHLSQHLREHPVEGLRISFDDFVQKKSAFIDQAPLAYPSLSKITVETAPAGTLLFLGNSTTIRSFDSYASIEKTIDLPTFVQRGASGIEGHLSSALGLVDRLKRPLVCVLGDISMLHDLNALQALKASQHPLTLVVVNNGGGGIFNLLPAGSDPLLAADLFTSHQVSFYALARALEIETVQVDRPDTYREALKKGLSHTGPFVVEAMVDDLVNQEIYRELKTIKL